ncbi:MAG TPA: hypothetical protein VGH87_00970, partial [Polyangiaceae bacterium]
AMKRFLLLACAVSLSACALDSGDEGSIDDEVKSTAVCATQHEGKTADGDAVIVCDQTYQTLPFVRPPKDGTSTFYVGISDMMEGGKMITRSGHAYALADSSGKVLSFTSSTSNAIVKSIHMPSNRNLYTLYKVSGEVGTGTDPIFKTKLDIIKATSIKPVILISGKAIDTAQTFGAWEGTVAARKDASSFDPNKRVPIRIKFSTIDKTAAHFATWQGGASLKDGDYYTVHGTVENLSAGVVADDGSCMPSLASLGTSSPFAGATSGDVSLMRVGGMHFAGDDEHVLTMPAGAEGWSVTAMGSFGRFLPSDFISTKAAAGDMTPHGTPSGAGIELEAVTKGGGTCK